MLPPDSLEDESGNCKRCSHPFDPHIVIAYATSDFSKGGEMRCPVENCQCYFTVSFNMKDADIEVLVGMMGPKPN